MFILGIESSCDDTSVALVDCSDQGHFVIAEKTASQIDVHQKYGGVVPEIAGRMHAEKIVPLIEAVCAGRPQPDAIAVTSGPGLVTGLIVGVTAASTLSFAKKIPLVATNHISGHIHSVEVQGKINKEQLTSQPIKFPALALVVSGGHTDLVLMKNHLDCKILGRTKDDAAGECFDKVAKLLGLPYPGGPQISKLAMTGRTDAIIFPRPMLTQDNYDFSFAGLKTAALYWLRDNQLVAAQLNPLQLPTGVYGQPSAGPTINDFCASFEQAIVDVLVSKTIRAAQEYKSKTVILAGGVAANKKLRETLGEQARVHLPATSYLLPATQYAMDNGAMIAVAGYYKAIKKEFINWRDIHVSPHWRVDEGQ